MNILEHMQLNGSVNNACLGLQSISCSGCGWKLLDGAETWRMHYHAVYI